MILLDLTLPTPAANLACDEVLLDLCDSGEVEAVLRFWIPQQTFVVVGYANAVEREVNVDFCASAAIPIFRRCSGGGTVLQSPGCLNYSVTLRIDTAPELAGIHTTNTFVLGKVAKGLGRFLERPIEIRGLTDLAMDELKIAGNAQRRKKNALLFHGCLLLSIDVELVELALLPPSRQPDYRKERSHRRFMKNLLLAAPPLQEALAAEWGARTSGFVPPHEIIDRLAREKYESDEWNRRF